MEFSTLKPMIDFYDWSLISGNRFTALIWRNRWL